MSLLDQTPTLTPAAAAELAAQLYGIQTTAVALPGERDQNFYLGGDRPGVLKIANAAEDRSQLAAQNAAMRHLHNGDIHICPQVIYSLDGAEIAAVTRDGLTYAVRLLTYLPGTPLARQRRQSGDLLHDLGRQLGRVDRALATFDHPAAHRIFYWDLARALDVIAPRRALIAASDLRRMVDGCVAQYQRDVQPRLPALRQSVIHGDANDYNVLVGGGDDLHGRNQRVVGLIDFGDLVYSHTVNELAIAIAYAVLDKPDPLAVATALVAGYHDAYPLTEDELDVLFSLVCMRLCVSICVAAEQMAQRPDDPYLAVSQQPIRDTLPRLMQIHPRFAAATFRHACGFAAVAGAAPVLDWLATQTPAPVLGRDLRQETCLVFDLGAGSPLIGGDPAENAPEQLTERLFSQMRQSGCAVGVGRYGEARLIYTAPQFAGGPGLTDERRTVHLGLDLFAAAGTAVHAPLPGVIAATAVNPDAQDYGGVLVLRHETGGGIPFYTLYGHLAPASTARWQTGQPVAAGEILAVLGTSAENGGWPPHLHLQLITDLLDLGSDFPGVCRWSQRAVWQQFAPDPNVLAGVPAERFPPADPARAQTLAVRRARLGRNLSIGYREPVKVVRGWRQYLFDETGRRYLDAYNNVPHVGHCHPRVVAAAQAQMRVLNTNTRYLHDAINTYAERLAATLPDPLSVCFFVNSASEANELALRLARATTGRRDMLVLEGAYHGHTTSLIDISPYKHDGPGGSGAPDWVHTAPIADVYRGTYKADDDAAAVKYAAHVAELVARLVDHGRAPAAFIAETCPSVGGQIIFPDGYLAAVYAHVRRAGGLCIADEVQTGYGRTGSHFYAFEAQGVVPDIVVLGKPIGNGHPIGAVVTTPAIADAFDNGMEFFSTFGGNTVSAVVGTAVLDVLRDEPLQANARAVGDAMLARLRGWVGHYPLVGDARGAGLFLGMELVRDHVTLEPAAAEAAYVANRMRDYGILLGTDGPLHNVVKIRPPMPFTAADGTFLLDTLEAILAGELSEVG